MFTKLSPILALPLLLGLICGAANADPRRILLLPFDDDLQSERLDVVGGEYSAAYPAGPQLTKALHKALTERGLNVVDAPPAGLELSGTVTSAYMMSRDTPTNSMAAHYQLLSLPGRKLIASGDIKAKGWRNSAP